MAVQNKRVRREEITKRNEEIRKLYDHGESVTIIAEKYSMSMPAVYLVLRGDAYLQKMYQERTDLNRKATEERYKKGVDRECQICSVPFVAHKPMQLRCAAHVKTIVVRGAATMYPIKCAVCPVVFKAMRENARFCPIHATEMKPFSGRERTREMARIRDHRTCQECGRKWQKGERRFDIHHINDCGKRSRKYDSEGEMDGLLTLCHRCHIGNHARNKIIERKARLTDTKREAILVLWREGWSQDKIAESVGTNQYSVSRYVNGK